MDEISSQNPDEQPRQVHPGLSHQKVIQPSSSLVEEMKGSQPAFTQPQPSAQVIPRIAPTPASPRSKQPASMSSVYPDTTSVIGTPPPTSNHSPTIPANESEAAEVNGRATSSSKVLAVKVVAGILILLDLTNAYDWFLERRAGYTSWINIIGICLGLALAIGIFKLSEIARAAYVYLSIILLVLAGVGLIIFYSSAHSVLSTIKPLSNTALENSIKAAQSNPSLTPKERQEIETTLQRQINRQSGSTIDVKVKQYFSTGLLIVTGIGPLIFFTRPSIKEVFT